MWLESNLPKLTILALAFPRGKCVYKVVYTQQPSSLLILVVYQYSIFVCHSVNCPKLLLLERVVLSNTNSELLVCLAQLRVNQDEPMEDYPLKVEGGKEDDSSSGTRRFGMGQTTKDQMRTNVINEIISTERDYIKHLKDICEVTE